MSAPSVEISEASPPPSSLRATDGLLHALFFLSGAAGLTYELIWTRQLCLVFGGSTYAITTTVSAFMAGLGIGSWLAGRFARRIAKPARLYGALEIAIGLYALLVPWLFHLAEPMYRVLYARSVETPWLLTAARFAISFVFLLLPTTAMGATLPILVRFATGYSGDDDEPHVERIVARLYGINTLGAVCGALATGFCLIPALGMTMTTRAAAAVNVIVGVVAIVALRSINWPRRREEREGREEKASDPDSPSRSSRLRAFADDSDVQRNTPRRVVLLAFALSGFAAMVYQVAWTRALIVSVGSSTYSFTCILAAFILGLALGSLAMARWHRRLDDASAAVRLVGYVELAIGLSAVVVLPLYAMAPSFVGGLVSLWSTRFGLIMVIEFMLIIAITLIPTFLMGMLFPLVTRIVSDSETGPDRAAAATGRAYAVNTLGTIAGALLGGFLLIRGDVLGTRNAILLAALLNALAGAAVLVLRAARREGESPLRPIALAVTGVGLVLILPRFFGRWDAYEMTSAPFLGEDIDQMRQRFDVLSFREDVEMNVGVMRTRGAQPAVISLRVNGKADASTWRGDMETQLWLGHLPALVTPDARSACVIGLGSGITAAAIAMHPAIQRIDCVELSRGVIDATGTHFAPFNHDLVGRAQRGEGAVRLLINDGRNHLLLTDRKYNLIVSEPSNPWISGVGNLFTREFFELCLRHLTPGGRACIWMHAYSMSQRDFQMVVRTLCDVFPHVSLWETSTNDYVLIATREAPRVAANEMLRAFATPSVREDVYRVGDGAGLERALTRFIAGGKRLRDWAGTGELHHDDNATLEFSAPRWLRGGEQMRILESLQAIRQSPFDEIVELSPGVPSNELLRARTATLREARDLRVKALLHQAHEENLDALRALAASLVLDPASAATNELATVNVAQLVRQSEEDDSQISGEVLALAGRIKSARGPTLAPAEGRLLPELARDLQSKARTAAANRNWPAAADDWAEACELDPQNGAIVLDLANALLQSNRADEARSRLEEALKRGTLTHDALRASKYAAKFRADPQVAALLDDLSEKK